MAATGVASEDAAGPAAPHIVLVDDNPDDRALAIRALRQAFPAVRVTEVRQAAEFERALAAEACDVVVTDYLLRWSDGLTVLRRVKERKADCPVILFTDSGSEEVAVEAMKAGADDYVIKVPRRAQRLATAIRLALERAELRARERAARTEAERQQAEAIRLAATLHTSAALAEALTTSQVADVAIEQGMAALGAYAGFVTLLTDSGTDVELASVVGYAQDAIDALRRYPRATATPITDVLRTREALWLETRDSLVERYPHLAPQISPLSRSWAYLPLLVTGRTVGVMGLSFPTERQFSLEERTFMLALARQCAQALERARLYRELAERERRLQDLVGRLLVAQEEERLRVAYEVHDDLAAVAASAHQHLQAFARHHRPRARGAREEFDQALELAQRMVRETRRVVANLRPTTLDDFGLAAALRLQVEELRAEGWQVSYQETLGPERLPPLLETALFRVAQEALTNVRKHAQITRVRVGLERAGREVRLVVEDEGRGFTPEALMRGTGAGERVGLPGMRERVAMLGGCCEVKSHPGAGTRVSVAIPLEPPTVEGTAHNI